jgi:chorismate dehydratase
MIDRSPAGASTPATVTPTGPVVARIPYLNAEPYYADWDRLPGTSVDLVPRRLGEEARAGNVDCGLMAAADWFSLEEEFERVGALGIACRGEVESVLLLAAVPIESLEGARILLTSESSTSAALIRILLERRFGLTGLRYERGDFRDPRALPEGEAWLVIGDPALAARRVAPGMIVCDLGSAWAEWTSLPFVYALWTARRVLPGETKAALAQFLDGSLERSDRALAARLYAGATGGRLGTAYELARYLARFVYKLGVDEERGLDLFRNYWKELPR